MVAGVRVAANELRKIIDTVHDDVDIAVIIEVAKGRPAGRSWRRNSGSGLHWDIVEMTIAQIAIQQLALCIAGFRPKLFHFGIDVPIADEDIKPTVVVHIEESAAPTEVLCVQA